MTGPQLRNETKPIRLLSRDKRAERRLGEMMAEQKETIDLAKPPTEKDEMGRFTWGFRYPDGWSANPRLSRH
jgi:hypothetical protein